MKRRNKSMAWIIIFSLVLSIFTNTGVILGASQTEVSISTAEELVSLAEKCTLDTWSQGKVISLRADIDVSGAEFEGIPIFNGTFEGNGYTITGLNITGSGSNQGLFRYVQAGAVIKNVTVKGNVIANGTKRNLGGIAGKNAGIIKDSMFVGTVKGESYIGGITGINESNGQIINCVTQGIALGEHYVGGIAGENLGTILDSKNKMSVNTSLQKSKTSLEELEKIGEEEVSINSTENTSSITDIGGITGFSTGIIQGCKNFGTVGYQHVGYNIGGIVGRQSGYVSDCTNLGIVYGRKDVGGIAGQMEPYISLEFSADKVSDFQSELSKLQNLMNRTINDVGGYSSELSSQLNTTKEHIDSALKTTDEIVTQSQNLYNQSIGQINNLSARISSTLEKLVPVTEQMQSISDEMITAVSQFEEVLGGVEITSEEGKKVLNSLQKALDTLQSNIAGYTKAMEEVSSSVKALKEAIGDGAATQDAMNKLIQGFSDLAGSLGQIGDGMLNISKQLTELKKWMKDSKSLESLITALNEAGEAIKEMKTAAGQMINALKVLKRAADEEEISAALVSLQEASKAFLQAAEHLKNAIQAINIEDANNSDCDKIMEELNEASNDLKDAQEKVTAALEHLKNASSNEASEAAKKELEEALNNLTESVKKVASASRKIKAALEELKTSISKEDVKESIENLNQHIESINEGLSDIQDATEVIQDALKDMSNQVDLEQMEAAADKMQTALDSLTAAAGSTEGVISDLKQVVNATEGGAEAADDTLLKLQEAVKTIKNIATQGSSLVNDIYGLISDLASQPTITFPELDSNYMNSTNQLSISLGDISNSLGAVNSTMSNYNDILLSDLQSLSNQFFVISNLLIDMTLNQDEVSTDINDYRQDISDADTGNNTQGKVTQCLNQGEIQGDVNVGGITGSMAIEYDFDPEDDVKKAGDTSLKFQYLARAVIRECTNKGSITAKKNYAGGIAGRMDLGTIIGSMGYGKIESRDGDYVGGVAGASYSHIRESFSMAVLSGNKSVGGIAGFANKLTKNYAMVDIESAVESTGAIAGNVEDINNQSNNYFVNRSVAGIDGISYTGKAESISYEEFKQVQGLPQEFTNLTLTFIAEGEEVAVLSFDFGGNIDQNIIPEVPEKEGYYGTWPAFDYDYLTFSATLEAIYTPYTSTIASSTARDGKSIALAEGTFNADAVLNVVNAEVAPPAEAGSEAEVYEVTVAGTNYNGDNGYQLRLLASEKGKGSIYALQQDGSWKKLNAKKNGSYRIINMEGSSQIFCISYKSQNNVKMMIVAAVVIVLAALGGLIIFKRRRKKM